MTTAALASAPDDPPPALLTVEEAARRLRIGRTTCFRLIRTGELESVPVGRLRRIPPEALTEYVTRLRGARQSQSQTA